MQRKILIIGTVPPPIGGVSIHIKRLLDFFGDFPIFFLDYKRMSILSLVLKGARFKVIHLHISNPKFRFGLVLLFKVLLKKVVVTFHGDIGRFKRFDNLLDNLCLKLADVPIVINKNSFEKAKQLNNEALNISAYIPPKFDEILPAEILDFVLSAKAKYSGVFSTNCSNYTLDNGGKDVYQILNLVQLFNELNNFCLIISDPKNSYEKVLLEKGIKVPTNVFFIKKEHSFIALLKYVDCFIRYTTTDGDSLSIHEALSIPLPVIATNVVPRPEGVTLVHMDLDRLKEIIIRGEFSTQKINANTGIEDIRSLYSKLLRL